MVAGRSGTVRSCDGHFVRAPLSPVGSTGHGVREKDAASGDPRLDPSSQLFKG